MKSSAGSSFSLTFMGLFLLRFTIYGTSRLFGCVTTRQCVQKIFLLSIFARIFNGCRVLRREDARECIETRPSRRPSKARQPTQYEQKNILISLFLPGFLTDAGFCDGRMRGSVSKYSTEQTTEQGAAADKQRTKKFLLSLFLPGFLTDAGFCDGRMRGSVSKYSTEQTTEQGAAAGKRRAKKGGGQPFYN